MSIAFLFPGQGSQFPGMLGQLEQHRSVRETLAQARQILACDIRTLDTEEALKSTTAVQLALFISGVATARALLVEGVKPEMVAGLSVGAFAAAVIAGALKFEAALPVIKLRGELMERAYPAGYGLSVVIGLDEARLTRLVERIVGPENPVFIASVNAPAQIVIAGSDAGMTAVRQVVGEQGARKTFRLPISVPSHCSLLAPVAEALREALREVPFRKTHMFYLSNRRARALTDPDAIREDLATNIAYPVRWHDCQVAMRERGARLLLEMPPGSVLTELAIAEMPQIIAMAVGPRSLSSVIAGMARERA